MTIEDPNVLRQKGAAPLAELLELNAKINSFVESYGQDLSIDEINKLQSILTTQQEGLAKILEAVASRKKQQGV